MDFIRTLSLTIMWFGITKSGGMWTYIDGLPVTDDVIRNTTGEGNGLAGVAGTTLKSYNMSKTTETSITQACQIDKPDSQVSVLKCVFIYIISLVTIACIPFRFIMILAAKPRQRGVK